MNKIKWVLILSAGLIVLFIVLGMLFKPEVEVYSEEEHQPLSKGFWNISNMDLVYNVSIGNESGLLHARINVSEEIVCITESFEGRTTYVCYDRRGNVINPTNTEVLSSVFRPWMLALNDSFRWSATRKSKVKFSFEEMVVPTVFTVEVIGRENVSGIECYVVRLRKDDVDIGRVYVSIKDRIMVKEEVKNGLTISLISKKGRSREDVH